MANVHEPCWTPSLAEQVTLCTPAAKKAPEVAVHVTAGFTATLSVAVAENEAVEPVW